MRNFSKEPIREILVWVNSQNPHRLNVSLHYSKPYLSSLVSLKPLISVDFVGFLGNLFPKLAHCALKYLREN